MDVQIDTEQCSYAELHEKCYTTYNRIFFFSFVGYLAIFLQIYTYIYILEMRCTKCKQTMPYEVIQF